MDMGWIDRYAIKVVIWGIFMKIKTLKKMFVFLINILLILSLIVSCSDKKKNTDSEEQIISNNNSSNQKVQNSSYAMNRDISTNEAYDLFAVINEDVVNVYDSINIEKESVGYLYKGSIILLYSKMRMKNSEEYVYFFKLPGNNDENNSLEGWVKEKNINIFDILKSNETILSNSKEIESYLFPNIINHGTNNMRLYDFPNYIYNTNDWIVYDYGLNFLSRHGITFHVKDLTNIYSIELYNTQSKNIFKYTLERNRFPMEDFKDIFSPEEFNKLKIIDPIYSFYFNPPNTFLGGNYEIEIKSDNKILFQTNMDFPEIPFRMSKLNEKAYYLQFITKTPLYCVIYGNEILDTRKPIKAYSIYPNNGIWEGILNIGNNFKKGMFEYKIYVFKMDENDPGDYSQLIDEKWNNSISINF